MINCIIFLSNLDFGDMYIVQMIQIKYLPLLKVQQVRLYYVRLIANTIELNTNYFDLFYKLIALYVSAR